jgi:hypothetical protein
VSEQKPFGPEELKARSRDLYVGNESDTDEYRETEPRKLLALVASEADSLDGDALKTLLRLTTTWLQAVQDRWGEYGKGPEPEATHPAYAGAEESAAVFGFIHDRMWDRGEHPYCDDLDDWHDQYGDDDGQGD